MFETVPVWRRQPVRVLSLFEDIKKGESVTSQRHTWKDASTHLTAPQATPRDSPPPPLDQPTAGVLHPSPPWAHADPALGPLEMALVFWAPQAQPNP